MLETGHLARLIDEDAVVGVTSNPTIFEKALSTGDWYDEQLRAELERTDDTKDVFFSLAVGAIEESIAESRAINVTLIFSLQRYAEVAEAYIRGLERLAESGGDPAGVISVASFFVSRVDTEADRRLEELGRKDLQGRLAVDNAKLAYEHYLEVFSGSRWEKLAVAGARPQRCLWASTSTKNPAYRDVLYVEELIGPDTVNTMPEQTIFAFKDHGRVERTVDKDLE